MYHKQGYSSSQGQPDLSKTTNSVYNIAQPLQSKISLYLITLKQIYISTIKNDEVICHRQMFSNEGNNKYQIIYSNCGFKSQSVKTARNRGNKLHQ